jgi:hypothetical protein
MARTVTRLESSEFLSVGTREPLVYAAPVDIEAALMNYGCLSDYPQVPRHL